MHIEPYTIEFADNVLADLRTRIHHTRWPDPTPGEAWEQGTDLDYLRELLLYWSNKFN